MTSPQRSLHPASGNDRGSFLGAVSGADYAAAEGRAKGERIGLHGGLQGAVTENRFNQIWDYVNEKLAG